MNPFSFLLPIFAFTVVTQSFNPLLYNKIEGEWSVVAKNYKDNITCHYINITNVDDQVYWKEDYQLNNQTVFYQEKIYSKDLKTFFSKKETYQILFNSYFKDFMVIQKNNELLILSKNYYLTYHEYFYLGASLTLVTQDNIYFINNNLC